MPNHTALKLAIVLERQLEFERELVGGAAAPLHGAQDLIDQATDTFREQATSFRVASKTFRQLAGLIDQQATSPNAPDPLDARLANRVQVR